MNTTFMLTITGTQNGEWQGLLTDKKQTAHSFESLLDLLHLVNGELEQGSDTETPEPLRC